MSVAWRRVLIAVTALALTATACGNSASGSDDEKQRSVEIAGKSVSVPQSPHRIVVLWQPTLAAVTQLGFTPVGTVADSTGADHGLKPYVPPDFPISKLTVISAASEINLENVSRLHPDLIIGASTGNQAQTAILPKLKKIATTVLLPWAGSSSWRQHLTDVGKLLGVPGKAQKIVAAYRAHLARVKAAVGRPAATTVSLIRIQDASELRLETPESFDGSVLADIGFARPRLERKPDPDRDFVSVSYERLGDSDADVVFAIPNLSNGGTAGKLRDNPLWPTLRAVKNKKAFAVDYAYWGATDYIGADRILDDVQKAFTGKLAPLGP
ncbi:MAG TPA: iron-siderophore ABC transporter substrate-binding protein [Mycobacteriales bacterium]|nr:iron-siderophore ABC transporter substrate-binding protein [Mycobacteriales bacterium]